MKKIFAALLFILPFVSHAQRKSDTYERLIILDSVKLNGIWYTAFADSAGIVRIITNLGLNDTIYVDNTSGMYADADTLKQHNVSDSTPGYATPAQKAYWDAGGSGGGGGGTNYWTLTGNNIRNNNTKNVGVGIAPIYPFHVKGTSLIQSDSIQILIISNTTDTIMSVNGNGTGALYVPPYIASYNPSLGMSFNPRGTIPGTATLFRIIDGSGYFQPGSALLSFVALDGNYGNVANSSSTAFAFHNRVGQSNATVAQINNLIAFSYAGEINNTNGNSSITGFDFSPKLTSITNTSVTAYRNRFGNNIFNSLGGFTGIGDSTPTATLHVKGGFRYVDGNQGARKVLTSDTSGNATWQAASGSGTYDSATVAAGLSTAKGRHKDGIVSGQSNVVNRDVDIGSWTYAVSPFIQSYDSTQKFVTANPGLNNISQDDIVKAPRNNVGFAYAQNYHLYHPLDTVRILVTGQGSQGSYLWTPKTTGDGEITTSNKQLDTLIARLNRTPSDFNASFVIWQGNEDDDLNNITPFFCQHIIEIYDTLKSHSKVDDNFLFIVNYPQLTTPGRWDSLARSIDSFYYHIKDIGTRNIIGVPYKLPGVDADHFSNESFDQIGKLDYWASQSGFGLSAPRPDTAVLKNGSGSYKYINESLVVNNTVQPVSGYPLQVSVTGASTGMLFERSNSGSNGTHQQLRLGFANDASGVSMEHWSETSSAQTLKDVIQFRDTSIRFQDGSAAITAEMGNNATIFNKPVTFQNNSTSNSEVRINGASGRIVLRQSSNTAQPLIIGGTGSSSGNYTEALFTLGSSTDGSNVSSIRAIHNGTGGALSIGTATTFGGITQGMIMNQAQRTLFGTGSTVNASAKVEIVSTTEGFLPPRMTTTQRDAISSPAEGLIIYNITTHKLNVFTTAWEAVTSL